MEKRLTTKLAVRREAFRLWFEYLKLAHTSADKRIKSALIVSEPFYSPWQISKANRFDDWWKAHSQLFEERLLVRALKLGEVPSDMNSLVVEIPLTQSPTILTKRVSELIRIAFEERRHDTKKSKKAPTAHYKLSEGAEPKLDAVREMLTIYRDVYLPNKSLRGEKLLAAAHRFYLGRKNKRWAKVPMPLLYDPNSGDDTARAMRNLRRYIQKAEKILLNVARGQFPGRY
jgi:hypothetical protein